MTEKPYTEEELAIIIANGGRGADIKALLATIATLTRERDEARAAIKIIRDPEPTGQVCHGCKTTIWTNQERVQDGPEGTPWWHTQCLIATDRDKWQARAEAAEAIVKACALVIEKHGPQVRPGPRWEPMNKDDWHTMSVHPPHLKAATKAIREWRAAAEAAKGGA